MHAEGRRRASLEEFTSYLGASDYQAEWLNRQIRLWTGGTPTQTLIAGNLVREMGIGLKGSGCHVYPSDLIIQLAPDGEIVFPDVSVVCGIDGRNLQWRCICGIAYRPIKNRKVRKERRDFVDLRSLCELYGSFYKANPKNSETAYCFV